MKKIILTFLNKRPKLKSFVKKYFLMFKKFEYKVNINTANPEMVGICHPDYRGVKSATYKLTPDMIEVGEITSRKRAKMVAKKLCSFEPKKVLISGYSLGYDLLASEIKKIDQSVQIFVFIHSSFTWLDNYPNENPTLSSLLELNKKGVIRRIGFCKKDLSDYFSGLGYDTSFVMNKFDLENHKLKKLDQGKPKIGVWGNNWWHRNLLNQVVAAIMLKNSEIHVNELKDFFFLEDKKIVKHGFLNKSDFLKIFSQMDINLYVSFTDCFPMTLIESMIYGIPAIASDTSDVYSFNPYLKNKLTLAQIDSPMAITKKIEEVISDYAKIQVEIKNYLPELKSIADESIDNFLA